MASPAIVSRNMAKEKTTYTCTECGGTTPRWLGKCPHCEAWNTLIETVAESAAPARNRFASLAKTAEVATLADIETAFVARCLAIKRWHGLWRHALMPIVIESAGIGRVRLDFARGEIVRTWQAADATIAPQPLLHVLANDFGLQTLGVSGRYRLARRGLNWMLHRILFSMINAGFGLSLRKLFRPEQLAFCWARRSDILRQVSYTLRRAFP